MRSIRSFVLSAITALAVLTPAIAVAAPNTPVFPAGRALAAAAAAATAPSSTTGYQGASSNTATPALTTDSNKKDLIALTQPTIVRILVHDIGTTTIPAFNVNLEKLTWSVGGTGSTKEQQVPYDTYDSGTGFIVNPNGYILTNSHVVSDAELKQQIAKQIVAGLMIKRSLTMTRAENARLTALGYTAAQFQQLAYDGVTFVEKHITLPTKPQVVVLSPSKVLNASASITATSSAYLLQMQQSSGTGLEKKLKELMASGESANVVSVNNNYINDEKDVALLHVNETNLPALALGDSTSVQTGDSIYVFGYPGNADLMGLNDTPSFTAGVVNAFKESTLKTFKYIQTDAKVSPGSSGSPLIDSSGKAVGMLTIGNSGPTTGDSFALALPIQMAEQMLAQHDVATSTPHSYGSDFLAGLTLQNQKHCKAANKEFAKAAAVNTVFGDASTYVQPYIDQCNALIASGQSLDTPWDGVRIWIESRGLLFWLLVLAGFVLVIGGGIVVAYLLKRNRREEETIEKLKEEVEHMEGHGTTQPQTVMPTVTPTTNAAGTTRPVTAATAAGASVEGVTAGAGTLDEMMHAASGTPTTMQSADTPAQEQNPAVQPMTQQPMTTNTATPQNVDPSLFFYIKNARAAGQSDEAIRGALTDAGWSASEIDAGFASTQ